MTVYIDSIPIESKVKTEFHDITDEVKDIASKSKIKNGIVTVYSPHTTCVVLIQEDSHDTVDGTKFLLQDLIEAFEKITPRCERVGQYRHPGPEHIEFGKSIGDKLPWLLNTHAHLRASMMSSPSQTIPLKDGELALGRFQRIYFVDLDDTRSRKRSVHVQILGE